MYFFTNNTEGRLGDLAMQFRGTRDSSERAKIAQQYAQAVHELIQRGDWTEVPAPEDQLPDECMPQEFFEYWARE